MNVNIETIESIEKQLNALKQFIEVVKQNYFKDDKELIEIEPFFIKILGGIEAQLTLLGIILGKSIMHTHQSIELAKKELAKKQNL